MPADAAVNAEVPFPFTRPVSVVAPVPPFATPRVPVRRLVPIDEVATTLPVLSVPKRAEVRPVKYGLPEMVRAVDDAYGNVEARVVEVAVM